jgi:hypothetical protein
MKKVYVYILLLVGFALLAGAVFRCAWPENKIFSGSDMNIGLLAAYHRALPERFTGVYSSTPVFGASSAMQMSLSNLATSILPPETLTNTLYGFYLVIASLALIAYLRLWNIRWMCCVLGALAAYWVGSVTLIASGHLNKLGVSTLFTVALLLVEKSMRNEGLKRWGFALLTGVSVGLMLLEQQDVGLLAGLFLFAYVLFRLIQTAQKRWLCWISVLAPIAVVGLAISSITALSAYQVNVVETGIRNDPSRRWDYITQWSMVPAETPDLIAPGYSGWSTGNPDGPYWGICGQSAEWKKTGQGFRNFRLDSSYIGVLPITFALLGIMLAYYHRKENRDRNDVFLLWGLLGLLAIMLSFGKFSVFYKLFYQLPLVGNIRAPIKFLQNFQIIVGILAAFGVDRLLALDSDANKRTLKMILSAACVLTSVFMISSIYPLTAGYEKNFSEWGDYASTITSNISRAWIHAAAMAALIAGSVFAVIKRFRIPGHVIVSALIAAVAYDSIFITTKYFKSTDISSLKEGNIVINYLKENQGDERIFFLEQSGIYNSWLASDVPYHGLQVFNIWQMPRMPAEYKEFLGTVGKNRLRLMQLASVKYVTAPAGILKQLEQDEALKSNFAPVMFYRFIAEENRVSIMPLQNPQHSGDQVLLEVKTYIPRLSLFHDWEAVPLDQQCSRMADPSFNPLTKVIVEPAAAPAFPSAPAAVVEAVSASTTRKTAVIRTNADRPGIVMFTQRYQPGRWVVRVDGEPVDLLRCNYLCMGAVVPAGSHEVEFSLEM